MFLDSQCQGECCKENYQHRKAVCIAVVNNKPRRLADSFCPNATKPKITRRRCERTDCPRWEVGQWSNCSVTCGSGEKSRLVKCYLGGEEVTGCCEDSRPPLVMACDNPTCPTGIKISASLSLITWLTLSLSPLQQAIAETYIPNAASWLLLDFATATTTGRSAVALASSFSHDPLPPSPPVSYHCHPLYHIYHRQLQRTI